MSDNNFFENMLERDSDYHEKKNCRKLDWPAMADLGSLRKGDIIGETFQIVSDLTSYTPSQQQDNHISSFNFKSHPDKGIVYKKYVN
jgi:hypothetical protein